MLPADRVGARPAGQRAGGEGVLRARAHPRRPARDRHRRAPRRATRRSAQSCRSRSSSAWSCSTARRRRRRGWARACRSTTCAASTPRVSARATPTSPLPTSTGPDWRMSRHSRSAARTTARLGRRRRSSPPAAQWERGRRRRRRRRRSSIAAGTSGAAGDAAAAPPSAAAAAAASLADASAVAVADVLSRLASVHSRRGRRRWRSAPDGGHRRPRGRRPRRRHRPR